MYKITIVFKKNLAGEVGKTISTILDLINKELNYPNEFSINIDKE